MTRYWLYVLAVVIAVGLVAGACVVRTTPVHHGVHHQEHQKHKKHKKHKHKHGHGHDDHDHDGDHDD